jgi:hypothetical protein
MGPKTGEVRIHRNLLRDLVGVVAVAYYAVRNAAGVG